MGPRALRSSRVASIYDQDTEEYLRHGIGLYLWFLLGESEDAHVDALIDFAELRGWLASQHVVDLGCGIGEFLVALRADFPCARYAGVTVSPVQWMHAQIRAPFALVDCADFNDWSMPDEVGLFILTESLGHVVNLPAFFQDLARSLVPNGRVLVQDVLSDSGLTWIPSWGYRVRSVGEVTDAAVSVGLRVRKVGYPEASTERARLFWAASPRIREVHQPGVGAANRCVLYLLEQRP